MIGNNQLLLNEGTMQEIIQYWIDNKFTNKDEISPKVKSVKYFDNMFKIDMSMEETK